MFCTTFVAAAESNQRFWVLNKVYFLAFLFLLSKMSSENNRLSGNALGSAEFTEKSPNRKKWQQPKKPLSAETYYRILCISMTSLVTKDPLSRLFQTSGQTCSLLVEFTEYQWKAVKQASNLTYTSRSLLKISACN